ncbi:YdaS antitoxin of YdaST toxin-antitoxin system [Paraburkholderia sp. BL8N3]|nr:YdaS antitoxin of YdaST toxin-antitoxin system [Paraburkholderia sp. BL8N3]
MARRSQSFIACLFDISPQAVQQWIDSGRVPAERCPTLERGTRGEIKCEELRPDVEWWVLRIRDSGADQSPSSTCADIAQ